MKKENKLSIFEKLENNTLDEEEKEENLYKIKLDFVEDRYNPSFDIKM
jgi:uncharacterized protein (UPF0262 family)